MAFGITVSNEQFAPKSDQKDLKGGKVDFGSHSPIRFTTHQSLFTAFEMRSHASTAVI